MPITFSKAQSNTQRLFRSAADPYIYEDGTTNCLTFFLKNDLNSQLMIK